jgi:hypothetical protein
MNFKMKTKMVSHLAQLTNQGDKKAKDNKEEDLLKNLKHRREEFKKQVKLNFFKIYVLKYYLFLDLNE